MFSKKLAAAAFAVLLICGMFEVSAQWSPMKTEINLGSFKLASSPVLPEPDRSPAQSTLANNTTINATLMNNSTSVLPALEIIDLSGYSKDRLSRNLAGYTNIMYPIAESGGFTATTSGGGGCGCG